MVKIDHITPIIYGYLNNIDPDTMSSLGNLCWTTRYNNIRKGSKDIKIFIEILKK